MPADYEPGTVAVATVRGVEGVRVIRAASFGRGYWIAPEWEADKICEDSVVTDVRPLVVLDLNAIEVPEVIVRHLRGQCGAPAHRNVCPWLSALADQIEAQTKPPRIPEPTECGATVIASQAGEIEGSDRLWVRFRHGKSDCWIDQYEHVRSWSDLDNPRAEGCNGDAS